VNVAALLNAYYAVHMTMGSSMAVTSQSFLCGPWEHSDSPGPPI
jgi:hypothetical protein